MTPTPRPKPSSSPLAGRPVGAVGCCARRQILVNAFTQPSRDGLRPPAVVLFVSRVEPDGEVVTRFVATIEPAAVRVLVATLERAVAEVEQAATAAPQRPAGAPAGGK